MGFPAEAAILGVALFLIAAAGNILTPLLPLVQRDFQVDYTTAGGLVSAYGLARLALDLPAGFLEEKLGLRRLAAAAFVLSVAGGLLTALGPGFDLVLVGRIGMGLGASVFAVVVLTSLSTIAPAQARGRVLATSTVANNSAIAIFPIVGGLMGPLWGWRSTMWLSLILTCVGTALLAWVLSRVGALERAARGGSVQAEVDVTFDGRRLLAIGTVYLGVVMYMVNRHGFRNTALPLFAHDRLEFDPLAIASGITIMAVVGLLIAIPGAMVGDRWNRRLVIGVGFVVLALGDFSFLGVDSYVPFLLACLLLGAGDFFSASQAAAVTDLVPARLRSRVLGGYRFAVDLGATIGPVLVAGLLQFAGYEPMIIVLCGLMLLAAGGAWVGYRATEKR